MPQMAPLNWLMLYFFFSTIFIMFLTQNYFTKIDYLNSKSTKKFNKNFNWKW